jgi:hypothetical protein
MNRTKNFQGILYDSNTAGTAIKLLGMLSQISPELGLPQGIASKSICTFLIFDVLESLLPNILIGFKPSDSPLHLMLDEGKLFLPSCIPCLCPEPANPVNYGNDQYCNHRQGGDTHSVIRGLD